MSKRALLTGITGQDGSYLAELLLDKGYEVYGLIRRSSSINTGRIDYIFERLRLYYGDLTDAARLSQLVAEVRPDEVYNLAAQSHVRVSFDEPLYTADVVALGTLRLLEAVRVHAPEARFYQASSSEMFGSSPPPQSERTPFRPRSPYACAKVFAHHAAVNYREAHGMHVSCGILFNHESERRGRTFVTRKIARAAARIKLDLDQRLYLGNMDAKRDWGYAPEYVRAMWLMLQRPKPDDYVIGTGETHSVLDFLQRAFQKINLQWQYHVSEDKRLLRPTEVEELRADARKARERLGWIPTVRLPQLVNIMVDAEMKIAKAEKA